MPIFEYRCRKCGERFERLLAHAPGKAPACPRCSGRQVERLFSTFTVTSAAREQPAAGPCGSQDCACRRDQGWS